MLVLAADTSLPLLSVALVRDASPLGAVVLEGKGSRNEKLLPAVDWLLAECNVARDEIDLFAVTRGPGSFTGVRIGLATLQGMALALGREVCAMGTHRAVRAVVPDGGRVVIRDDAGRGEWYVSLYDGDRELAAPRLIADAAEVMRLADGARIVDVAEVLQVGNVASGCARAAVAIVEAGELGAFCDTTPIYVRLAEAEVKLQQRTHA